MKKDLEGEDTNLDLDAEDMRGDLSMTPGLLGQYDFMNTTLYVLYPSKMNYREEEVAIVKER